MRFIGDVHGRTETLAELLSTRFHDELVFQLGDMGLGFRGVDLPSYPRERFLFIRGNHDDPQVCREHPNYAGDWGTIGEFFFLGGAWSIDQQWRRAEMRLQRERIWWPDEELSQEELDKAVKEYKEAKPRLVATHDGPTSITKQLLDANGGGLFGGGQIKTRTGEALEEMLQAHQPEMWFFGHYHHSFVKKVGATVFECLPELATSAPVIRYSLASLNPSR